MVALSWHFLPYCCLLWVASGCLSKGDVNVKQGEAKPTCNSACEHLQAETFGDCKKWTDYDDCVAECADHAPTEDGLQCILDATNCAEFKQCDTDYDVF